MSAYAGQEIYVAIRHFFTAQEWSDSGQGLDYDALNIDDITFENVVMKIQHTSTFSYDDPYYFNVTASNSVVLPTVENVTATALSGSKVELTWNAPAYAATYKVYDEEGLVAESISSTTYTVYDLEAGEHCFTVIAVNAEDSESVASNQDCAVFFEKIFVLYKSIHLDDLDKYIQQY